MAQIDKRGIGLMRESIHLCSCFTVMWFTASQRPPQMAEEASHATSVWIRSTIQSVSHNHMHISPYSCVANQTPLESSWLLPANPMYLVIFLLFSPMFNIGPMVESSVFATYILQIPSPVWECTK